MKIASNLDLLLNQLINAVIDNQSSAPSSPIAGQIYYNTSTNKLMIYNGSSWIDMLARANHSGTQLASTISDFDTQVRTSRLDQMAAPTASVSLNSQKITNLLDPTNPQDAATKAYADSAAAGIDAKASCRVATTANITLSGTQTIDGITVSVGDRVLVKDQSTASFNGIYVVASGSWSRATDCDSSSEYTAQAFTFIEEGTANASTQWKVSTTGSITVGTTSVTWAQWGAGATYTAGDGLQISGNQFSAKLPASSGLVADGTGLYVDAAIVAKKYATNVGDGSSTSITVTHNLGTRNVQVHVYRNSTPWDQVIVDNERTTTNTVTLKFATAPSSAQYTCVVIG